MVQVSRENTKLSYDLISNDKIIFSVFIYFIFFLCVCWFLNVKVVLRWGRFVVKFVILFATTV